MINTIFANNNKHLKGLIAKEIDSHGFNCNLNHIDVSRIQDMSGVFENSDFNGDISKWNVSNVTNMNFMFHRSAFNGDISSWDTSNLNLSTIMFSFSAFNGDISKWNVERVENMNRMFEFSNFYQDLSNWKPYALKTCVNIFNQCPAPMVYWIGIKNHEDRIKTIQIYHQHSDLTKKLNSDKKSKPKVKI